VHDCTWTVKIYLAAYPDGCVIADLDPSEPVSWMPSYLRVRTQQGVGEALLLLAQQLEGYEDSAPEPAAELPEAPLAVFTRQLPLFT
jgi:hypothetical protein